MDSSTTAVPLSEIARVFLKLGLLGFGGPAAHIAMMRKELVEKRRWISEGDFMDLVGATQLIPGPNSTELAMHLGRDKGGVRGLLVAGCCFIFPAFLSVLVLAIIYVRYGDLPAMEPVFYGLRPVILAVIIDALFQFRRSAVPGWKSAIVALLALLWVCFGGSEVVVTLGLGLLYAALFSQMRAPLSVVPVLALPAGAAVISGTSIFFFFFKIGSILFGSGYVLLAFLQGELVEARGWLTEKQLLDAVTVGQFTPGPVFTTATFIGYLLKGLEGGVLATTGIFLPSFFFVALSSQFIKRMSASRFWRLFLDAVNAASFALLLKVSFDLGLKSIVDFPTLLIGLVSLFVILKFRSLNSAWVIIAGGALGPLLHQFFLPGP